MKHDNRIIDKSTEPSDLVLDVKDLTVTYKESRNVDLKKTVLDNTKIRELYKKPLKPFREGLREYYEFLSGCR